MLLNSNYIYMWLIGVRKVYLPQGPWTFLTPLYSQYDPFINIGVAMEGVRGRAGKGGGWNQSWNLRKIKNFGVCGVEWCLVVSFCWLFIGKYRAWCWYLPHHSEALATPLYIGCLSWIFFRTKRRVCYGLPSAEEIRRQFPELFYLPGFHPKLKHKYSLVRIVTRWRFI